MQPGKAKHAARPAGMEPAFQAAACVVLYQLARSGLKSLLHACSMALALRGWGGPALEVLDTGGLLAATLLAAVPPLYWVRCVVGLPWPQLGLRPPRQRVMAVLPLCVAAVGFACLPGLKLGREAALPPWHAAAVLAFVQLCVASPLVEELLFRGALQRLLRPYGAGVAILAQAALFAAMHGSAAQKAFAFPAGLLFGWAAWYSGSLWTGFVLHSLNNGCLFLLMRMGGAA